MQIARHKHDNVEEVGSIGDWMEKHGWSRGEADGIWNIEVEDTISIPTAPFGFVKNRVASDMKTGHVIETCTGGLAQLLGGGQAGFAVRSKGVLTAYEQATQQGLESDQKGMPIFDRMPKDCTFL